MHCLPSIRSLAQGPGTGWGGGGGEGRGGEGRGEGTAAAGSGVLRLGKHYKPTSILLLET